MSRRKPTPKLALTDLLRRRKLSLADYVERSGITTYEKLLIVCERQFVLPPPQDRFEALVGGPKSNPAEGVAVIGDDHPETLEDDGQADQPPSVQRTRKRRGETPEKRSPEVADETANPSGGSTAVVELPAGGGAEQI